MFTIDETPGILVAVFGKVASPICQSTNETKNGLEDCINVIGVTMWIIEDECIHNVDNCMI